METGKTENTTNPGPFNNEDAQCYSVAILEGSGKILILGDSSGALAGMVSQLGMEPVSADSDSFDSIWVKSDGSEEFLKELPGSLSRLSPGGKLMLVGTGQFPFGQFMGDFKVKQKKMFTGVSYAAVVCTNDVKYTDTLQGFAENHPAVQYITGELTSPDVSVLIPTYNRADLLPYAVQSVLAQNYGNFEILIMDDGSTDRTSDYLKSIEDPRVKFFTRKNAGAPTAFNVLMAEARGKYHTVLGDDDFYLPHHLKTLIQMLENDDTLDYVWGDTLKFQKENDYTFSYYASTRFSGEYVFPLFLNRVCFYAGSYMIRAGFQRKIGDYDPDLIRGQDMEMFRKMSLNGKGRGIPLPVHVVRVHQALRGSASQKMDVKDHHTGTIKYTSSKLFEFLKGIEFKNLAGVSCQTDSETWLVASVRAFTCMAMHNNLEGMNYYLQKIREIPTETISRGAIRSYLQNFGSILKMLVTGKLSGREFAEARELIDYCLMEFKKINQAEKSERAILILDEGEEGALERTLMYVLDNSLFDSEILVYGYRNRKNIEHFRVDYGINIHGPGQSLPDLIHKIAEKVTGLVRLISSSYPWQNSDWPTDERITTIPTGAGNLPIEITIQADRLAAMKMQPVNTPALLKVIADEWSANTDTILIINRQDFNNRQDS